MYTYTEEQVICWKDAWKRPKPEQDSNQCDFAANTILFHWVEEKVNWKEKWDTSTLNLKKSYGLVFLKRKTKIHLAVR